MVALISGVMFWSFAKGSVVSVLGMLIYLANLVNMFALVISCLATLDDHSCKLATTVRQAYLACQAFKLCILLITVSLIVYVRRGKLQLLLTFYRHLKPEI